MNMTARIQGYQAGVEVGTETLLTCRPHGHYNKQPTLKTVSASGCHAGTGCFSFSSWPTGEHFKDNKIWVGEFLIQ